MIKFTPTNPDDAAKIREWIDKDPFHTEDASDEMASSMVTGAADCILSCAVEDEEGRVLYLQLTDDGNQLVRIGTQFAPQETVSQRRVASAIAHAMPALRVLSLERNARGMIFFSNSPELIRFMSSFGFESRGDDQYVWMF